MSDVSNIVQVAGVYRIRNTINGKVYAGSALNIRQRLGQHRACLQAGRHDNRHLQYAFEKYGEQAFAFETLEEVAALLGPLDREWKLALRCNLLFWEQVYIDNYLSGGKATCYNLSPTAGNTIGVQYTDEAKAKLSAKAKGRPSWCKGLTKATDPRIAAYAAKHKGYRLPEEIRAKLRYARPYVAEMNRARKGVDRRTPEHTEKMLSAIRGKPFTDAHKDRIRQQLLGREFSGEHRARLKESQNKPETRARRIASLLLYNQSRIYDIGACLSGRCHL